jgi:PST family polysaccharide transporter
MVRNLQFRLTAATDWIGGLAEAIAAISLAFAGFGYWSLVYARLVGTVFNVGAKIAFGRWVPSLRFSRAAIGELFSFASGLFAKRLLDYAANNLDNLVVGRTLGIVSLGFYDKAFVTMNKVLMRINTGGPGVSFRIFSLIYEDPERFRRAYRRVLLATSLMSFPLLAALSASAHDLIVVLYGPRWAPAVVPFQVLCAAAALKIINEYAGSAAQAVGKIWGQVWRQAVYALMIVICVAAFRFWGLRGAAFGVLVATVVMTLLMYGLLVRLTGMRAADLAIPALPGIVAAVGTAGVELLVRAAILSVHPAARHWELLFVELAAGATFYAAYLKFHPSRQVRTLLREVAADLAPPIGTVARFLA